MMRANMHGMSGVKGMMLKHGEKVGMGVVGLAVVWFVYSSIGRDSLSPNKPEELKNLVTSASSNIENTKWDELTEEDKKIADDAKLSSKRMVKIQPAAYSKLSAFDHSIVSNREPRRDPVLLAIVDLEVHPGAGIMPHVDPVEAARRAREEAIEEEQERKAREDGKSRENDAARSGGGERGMGGGPRRGNARNMGGMGSGRLGGGGSSTRGVIGDDPDVRMIDMANRMEGFVPEGTERLDLTYWNCIVGKVPIKKQIKEFSKALQNSFNHDPSMDYPQYIVYVVERKEITDSGESEWQRLKPRSPETKRNVPYINDKYLEQLTWDWPMRMEPVVGSQFVDSLLTFPLPPVVGHQWGNDATHSDIPIFDPNELPKTEQDEAPLEDDGESFGDDVFVGGSQDDGMGGMRGTRDGARPSSRAGGRSAYGGRGMEGRMPNRDRSRGSMVGMSGRSRDGMTGRMGGSRSIGGRGREMGSGYSTAVEAEYLLFRFFDFSVRPGKKYSYRVRFVLNDPNHDKSRRDLAPEVIERRARLDPNKLTFRISDWSEPSPVVGVPLPGKVLVGEVKPAAAKSHISEPSAKLVLSTFEALTSEELISEQERCYRGKVCNLKTTEGWVVAANRRELHRKKNYLIRTGVMLADMSGGEKLDGNRDMTSPGEVLLMSPTGRLYVRSEQQDANDVFFSRALLEEEKDRESDAGNMMGRGRTGLMRQPSRGRAGGRER